MKIRQKTTETEHTKDYLNIKNKEKKRNRQKPRSNKKNKSYVHCMLNKIYIDNITTLFVLN